MFKRYVLLGLTFFLFPLSACQSQENSLKSSERVTPHSIAYNYIFTHGMCIGYLGSLSSVSLTDFQDIFLKDQNAKHYVMMALSKPNNHNLKNAKNSVEILIQSLNKNNIR